MYTDPTIYLEEFGFQNRNTFIRPDPDQHPWLFTIFISQQSSTDLCAIFSQTLGVVVFRAAAAEFSAYPVRVAFDTWHMAREKGCWLNGVRAAPYRQPTEVSGRGTQGPD